MATIEETLDFILNSILPDQQVTVDALKENDFIQFTISAPSEVVGRIIGKDGRIIKSIRALLSLSYPNQKFTLEIKD